MLDRDLVAVGEQPRVSGNTRHVALAMDEEEAEREAAAMWPTRRHERVRAFMPEPGRRPVQLVLRDDTLERNRVTVCFRLILAIPHLIWWWLWGFGALIVLPFHWIYALFAGIPASGLHSFYAMYVRYSSQVYAYVSLAADPYPGFVPDPGEYVVDVEVAGPERQPRWTILLRLALALPPLVLTAVLVSGAGGGGDDGATWWGADSDSATGLALQASGVLATVMVLLWFSCLVRGRSPRGLRDLALYCIGYAAQAYGYVALLSARYPDSSPALTRPASQPDHPVRAQLDDDRRRGRMVVLFRALLVLPHLVWLTLWGILVVFVVIANWLCALFAGRVPAPLHRFVAAYLRYQTHVTAFLWLAANPFPGFLGRPGTYPYELEIDSPAPQHRAVTLFRLVLVVPALMVSGALSSVLLVCAVGGWVVALFTAKMPSGLRDLNAFCVRYGAQVNAYMMLLTDRYPYSGPTLATGFVEPGPEPTAQAPGVPPAPSVPLPPGWAPPVAPPTTVVPPVRTWRPDRPEAL
ncbi:MAG: DUF4389 domain-containing protein [Solirubrobacteraceae bacterium]